MMIVLYFLLAIALIIAWFFSARWAIIIFAIDFLLAIIWLFYHMTEALPIQL